jgi:hypothetical protein
MGAAPRTQGRGRPWFPSSRGLSLLGPFARVGDLGPTNASSLAGIWQIAFLGETEPRAARPGRMPASDVE